jgi:DDE family transposase
MMLNELLDKRERVPEQPQSRQPRLLKNHPTSGSGARSDTGQYPSGIIVSDAEMAAINIKRAEFHGEWNYTISPKAYPPECAFIS